MLIIALVGYLNQDDNATLKAAFLDQSFQMVGQVILGPVLAVDRGNQTGLLPQEAPGAVPVGARYVTLYLTLTRLGGGDNDGSADNISLILLPSVVPDKGL